MLMQLQCSICLTCCVPARAARRDGVPAPIHGDWKALLAAWPHAGAEILQSEIVSRNRDGRGSREGSIARQEMVPG